MGDLVDPVIESITKVLYNNVTKKPTESSAKYDVCSHENCSGKYVNGASACSNRLCMEHCKAYKKLCIIRKHKWNVNTKGENFLHSWQVLIHSVGRLTDMVSSSNRGLEALREQVEGRQTELTVVKNSNSYLEGAIRKLKHLEVEQKVKKPVSELTQKKQQAVYQSPIK